jgi:hypothetical protein
MAVFIALEPLYTRREMEDGVLSSTLLTESQEAVLVINGKRKSSNEADRKAKSRQVEGKKIMKRQKDYSRMLNAIRKIVAQKRTKKRRFAKRQTRSAMQDVGMRKARKRP